LKIDILTLFPEIYPGALGSSIVGRAVRNGLVNIRAVDLRDYAHDRRGTVDDRPYGGGPGMLMNAEILSEAIDDLRGPDTLVILTSPRGKRFEQREAEKLSREKSLLFVCGHYEGVDQRVLDLFIDEEISIGDYVLTGGELPAMVVADCVSRYVDGVINTS
jgi:tRNA (guanine37-N1)-methyltransferase